MDARAQLYQAVKLQAYVFTLFSPTVYRSELGPQHKLTLQAQEQLDKLSTQLGHQVMKY